MDKLEVAGSKLASLSDEILGAIRGIAAREGITFDQLVVVYELQVVDEEDSILGVLSSMDMQEAEVANLLSQGAYPFIMNTLEVDELLEGGDIPQAG
jgi:DNA-binding cell septation regulator SpoVG